MASFPQIVARTPAMAAMTLTPAQQSAYYEDRRPALHASLSVLLVILDLLVPLKFFVHLKTYYRPNLSIRSIFAEDWFLLLSTALANVIIACLLTSTSHGLGLHSWRINVEDPHMPHDISTAFMYVWIVMVLTGITFSSIKLSVLYFYRRIFMVNHRGFRRAWWTNWIYVILWFFGATGFYVFQCWPVQWYFMQYYSRYHVKPPYAITGQCNATSTPHVAAPLIAGLISDVAILILPIWSILKLRLSRTKKVALTCVFAVGFLACSLDMSRIIELWIDTDDKRDPSYGVVIFLILSAATEVTAIVCACLPVVGPYFFQKLATTQKELSGDKEHGYKNTSAPPHGRKSHGFKILDGSVYGGEGASAAYFSHAENNTKKDQVPLSNIAAVSKGEYDPSRQAQGCIWVDSEIKVTVGKP